MKIENLLFNYLGKRDSKYVASMKSMQEYSSFMDDTLKKVGEIDVSALDEGINAIKFVLSEANKLEQKLIFLKTVEIYTFKKELDEFKIKAQAFESEVEKHNNEYYKCKLQETREIIGKIEEHDLDNQQLYCIMKDAHNHNVVAGAGTGKTTTIIGKVKYLINTKKYDSSEILVLSYTHAAAKEMKERLKRNTDEEITVSTFHRFGYSILTTVEKRKPNIFTDSINKFIKEELKKCLENKQYQKLFYQYIGSRNGLNISDLDSKFASKLDYDLYVKEHQPVTLKKEKVKSYGEMRVANFLAIHGINYCYEKEYEFDTATEEHAQYKPDFYLPDYNIYIEYFGINRNGEVPVWFEGDNPTESYKDGMIWKRKMHKQYNTKLIECYAYEDSDGMLDENLSLKLENENIELKEIDINDFFADDKENDFKNIINAFVSEVITIINLAKNKKINSEKLEKLASADPYAYNMAKLITPLRNAYDCFLIDSKHIDFADMLIKAEEYIQEGKYQNTYKCIIVDEYQDISSAQFRLLKALRNSKDFDLFCVGDDWQSIYQFNGSDVSYIMDFKDFWGPSVTSRIETTYRFSQSLINISGEFVMENPRQIQKKLLSKSKDNSFAVTEIEGYKIKYAIKFMADRMIMLPKNSNVYLLGRYTFDIDMLKNDERFTVKYDIATETQKVYFSERKDLNITFYTVHKSKGLQADYVFILNNTCKLLGFPSKVEDTTLKNMLLEHDDSFQFAEERRLFYVALTRAKKHVFLIVVKNEKSIFVEELEYKYHGLLKKDIYTCPLCGGRLRVINGKNGRFWGCSNYKTLNCRFTKNID